MKKLVVALGAGTLAAGVPMVQLWTELREVRAQTILLNERIASLMKRGVTKPDMTAKSADELSPGFSAAASVPARETHIRELRAAMARSEELSKARRREMMPDRYPDVGKELMLTPSQLGRFFDLLASQQNALMADVRAKGAAQFDAAARKQTNEAELASLLGDKYLKWQEYQTTLPVRLQVARLQSDLGSDAMSETQYKMLIAALAAEKVRNQESRRSSPKPQNIEDVHHAAEENNNRLVNAAAVLLNPRQLEAYRRLVLQDQGITSAMMDIMRPPAAVNRPIP